MVRLAGLFPLQVPKLAIGWEATFKHLEGVLEVPPHPVSFLPVLTGAQETVPKD